MIKEIAGLPDISFIGNKTLDQVQAEMVADYEAKYSEIEKKPLKLRRADPETLKLYAAAVQIFQMYMHIDNSGKMDLLKYAYGEFLDHLGANRGVTRLPAYPATVMARFTLSEAMASAVTIPKGTRISNGDAIYFETDEAAEVPAGGTYADVPATCQEAGEAGNGLIAGALNTIVDPIPYVAGVASLEETSGGSDIEKDEDFAERIYLAPSGYSVAGPRDAYIYHARSCSASIGDVEVSSPKPCEVEVRFLLTDASMPTESLIADVEAYLSADAIRPLTDRVKVLAPTGQAFDLSFTYWINKSDLGKAATIQAEVAKAVEAYIKWQTGKIGRDINPSVLTQMVIAAGAKRVAAESPAFTVVPAGHVPRAGSQEVTYGGVEDD
ncbi:MAG: baseplate J/gp47 family protein [Clostridia bacterium]|nr:baseplate J/gp47 family protein [Clostridia bacterium]